MLNLSDSMKIPEDFLTRWPAAKLEWRAVGDLIPYARNARVHTPDQIAQIAASIQEFGWTVPLLIDEAGEIIAGHGRILAAPQLGIETVPVLIARGWSDQQKRAYRIADNQIPAVATWDLGLLGPEIEGLKSEGFDLALTGFTDETLAGLFGRPAGQTDPDDAPEPQPVAVSRLGDLWLLGDHRLGCGDATDPADVTRAIGDAKPHLMVTDPPYGVDYEPGWRNRDDVDRQAPGHATEQRVPNDTRVDWRLAWGLFGGDVAYIWCASLRIHETAEAIIAAGFQLRASIVWRKQQFIVGRGHYHWQHEPCWYAVRKGSTGHWQGNRSQSTVWDINTNSGFLSTVDRTFHATQKPIDCMRRPIENNSRAGDAVYDPFVGSGTTIIAAEMMGRRCIAIEVAPQYVDVAVRRWQQFTGKTGTLDQDGRSFDEIAAERAALPAG